MRGTKRIASIGALLTVLAGCVSQPPACEWTEPGPLSPELMREPSDLTPVLDRIIQPYDKASKSNAPK